MKTNKFLIISSALFLFLVMIFLAPIDSLLSHTSHRVNDDNRSYFNSHDAYAATTNTKSSDAKSFTVITPKGSANPDIDFRYLCDSHSYIQNQLKTSSI